MKQKLFLTILCTLMLAASCGGGGTDVIEPTPQPEPTTPEPTPTVVVSFVPYLDAPTRATDTSFDINDRVGVFAVESSGSDNRAIIADHGNYADNVQYQYDGSRFNRVNTGIEIPQDGKLYYTAIYPYVSNASNSFTFGVNGDQRTPEAYTSSDLCTASTNATSEKLVDLRFSHRLSKIVINLTGDGWNSSDIQVKVKNVHTSANVNLNNLTFTAIGSTKDVICASNGTLSYKVILPPQSVSQNEKLFVITMNGADYTVETQGNLEFHSGKAYEYTINMDANHEIVEFTGDINPWNVDERINDVVPEDIQEKISPYIPIYRGNTPPNIEGTIFVDPFQAVYCEDYGNGGYAPGAIVNSTYIRFSNQNSIYNTLDIDQTNASGTDTSTGTGAFISGSGNNFSAFFNTIGQTNGISTKTALVISGTKASGGIVNLKYAFIMVEKGSDPNKTLMEEGIFRVFEDQDGMSEYTSWPRSNAPARQNSTSSQFTKGSVFSIVK